MKGLDAVELRRSARGRTSALRTDDTVQGYIDPGFINRRLIGTLMTSSGVQQALDSALASIDPSLPEWRRGYAEGHVCTQCVLQLCRLKKVVSLIEFASAGVYSPGEIVCSTDEFKGRRFQKNDERAEVSWRPPIKGLPGAKLKFSIENIVASTTRSHLQETSIVAHVSRFVRVEDDTLVFEPLVMGGPWLLSPKAGVEEQLMWHHFDHFQLFTEDVDEFAKVKAYKGDTSGWIDHMGNVSEEVMKTFIADLLGDQSGKDWGGEFADHFTRHIHIAGRRCTAAFLLKGPGSKHQQMTFRQLGKNGDQIFRLSKLPADLFVLQHCHEIAPAVLETLRNYIVQPHRQRRYLVIDGRDSYQLLLAYGKLDWALEETKKEKVARKSSRRRVEP